MAKKALKDKAKLGSGKRFAALQNKLQKQGKGATAAKAIAASIGMKKYGKKKMTAMAKKGKMKK